MKRKQRFMQGVKDGFSDGYANMKPCKVCSHMVAKSAEWCPQCGAQLRVSFGRAVGAVIVICISLLLIFGGLFL